MRSWGATTTDESNSDKIEIPQDVIEKMANSKSDEESKKLLELLGMPFVKIGQGL